MHHIQRGGLTGKVQKEGKGPPPLPKFSKARGGQGASSSRGSQSGPADVPDLDESDLMQKFFEKAKQPKRIKIERDESSGEESSMESDPGQMPTENGLKSCQSRQKKTEGKKKIKMEFIADKGRRLTTFSKRKTGIMKKAYELSTLTGTQMMLLVASETGHVYTFATKKLQPIITSDAGKALIQTCLNTQDEEDSDTRSRQGLLDEDMEETEFTYNS